MADKQAHWLIMKKTFAYLQGGFRGWDLAGGVIWIPVWAQNCVFQSTVWCELIILNILIFRVLLFSANTAANTADSFQIARFSEFRH